MRSPRSIVLKSRKPFKAMREHRPVHIELVANGDPLLDPDFYRGHYEDLAGHDESAARLHWNRHGRLEGRAPNARAALLGHPAWARMPHDFDAVAYLHLNRDLGARYRDPFSATFHFLSYGMAEGRSYSEPVIDHCFRQAFMQTHTPPQGGAFEDLVPWAPGTLDAYLYISGMEDAGFPPHMDHVFYGLCVGLPSATAADRVRLMFHFVEEGSRNLVPISPKLVFDPAYYRRHRASGGGTFKDDADLYREWLQCGIGVIAPSHAESMRHRFGVACRPEQLPDLGAYRLANDDLRTLGDEALLEQFLAHGLHERRSSFRIEDASAAILAAAGDHLRDGGGEARAEDLYLKLAHHLPNHPLPQQRLGDLLRARGRHAEAFQHYERLIRGTGAGKWTFINAAACCDALGDLSGACATMARGCEAYAEDLYMRRLRDGYAERLFADKRAFARAQALAGDIPQAQATLIELVKAVNFGAPDQAPGRVVERIAICANTDLAQCVLYRVEQKAEFLRAAGFHTTIFDWNASSNLLAEMSAFDAIVFYRVAATPAVVDLINRARAAGLTTFYDIDDLLFDAEHFPEPFSDYAGQISPEEHADLALGVPLFKAALGLCDIAIASTPSLADRMAPLARTREARIVRNALGARHLRAVENANTRGAPSPGGRVTIFHGSGTKAHKRDFQDILLPAFAELSRRYGDRVQFVVVGFKPIGLALPAPYIRYEEASPDVEEYWEKLSRADINVSVLRRSALTDAKSEIKWLEAAMFGVPSVVSATETFVELVEDGVDAFLAQSTSDFVDRIARLVEDADLRARMGEAARTRAFAEYSSARMCSRMREVFNPVVGSSSEALRPTRILVVNVFWPPTHKGGATRVAVDNVRDIARMYPGEFQFEVFTTLEGGLEPYAVEVSCFEGVRVTAMVASNRPDADVAAKDQRAGAAFRRCVDLFAPDVIHFHCVQRITASALEVASELKIPYFVTAHDGWWICDKQFLYNDHGPLETYRFGREARISPPLGNAAYDRPDQLHAPLSNARAILAVSETFADVYRTAGLSNVICVANGVPALTSSEPATEGAPRRRVRIGHVGGTEAHKGFPLLQAAVITGGFANLEVLVVDLALQPGEERLDLWGRTPVRLISRVPPDDVGRLYARIDVLFAPSLWPESFGLVTREAASAGCWIVASDRGAIAQPVMEGINGHVVNVDSVSDLIRVLAAIDADPTRYTVRTQAPLQRSSEQQAAEIASLYRDAARLRLQP